MCIVGSIHIYSAVYPYVCICLFTICVCVAGSVTFIFRLVQICDARIGVGWKQFVENGFGQGRNT